MKKFFVSVDDVFSSLGRLRALKAPLFIFLILSNPSFLFASDRRDSKSPFGVLTFLDWNHDWNAYHYDNIEKIEKDVLLMKKAGVGFVRQTFPWNIIEENEGEFNFERYDQIVEILGKKKIPILGTLSYTAEWTGRSWNEGPDPDLFVEYVREVVTRYKDRVKYWELWNEPDQVAYWKLQDRMVAYTELLKRVYPTIKEIDPTAVVVLGSVNTPFPLQNMYRNGAKPYFDVVNVHPFVNPLVSQPVQRMRGIYDGVRKAMAQNQDEHKPIWFTEIGCPGVVNPDGERGWWEGVPPSEQQQAEWVYSVYKEALKWPNVEKIFWAFFRDTESFGDGVDYFGLVRNNFSTKPAYEAFRRAVKSVN